MKKDGFTLVEVMLAVALLALGTLFIQEGLLRSATLYGRYANTMRAAAWSEGVLWKAREAVLFSPEVPAPQSGEFSAEGVPFRWSFAVETPGGLKDLYALRLTVEWSEGGRPMSLVREIHASKPPQPS